MRKLSIFFKLLILAVIIAGLFGAVHNQLSYSIGASYFFDLKFAQFSIPDAYHNRIGASLVGLQASWWMGLVVGIPAFGLGLLTIRNERRFLASGMSAIVYVLATTILFSMAGLILGMIAPEYADQLPLPDGISQPDSFLRAALMHEASYYGGFTGVVIAIWTMWKSHKQERMA